MLLMLLVQIIITDDWFEIIDGIIITDDWFEIIDGIIFLVM